MKEKDTHILVVDALESYTVLERKLNELQAISGMTLDELIEKFKEGWALKEPDPALKLANELNELTSGIYKCLKEKGVIK